MNSFSSVSGLAVDSGDGPVGFSDESHVDRRDLGHSHDPPNMALISSLTERQIRYRVGRLGRAFWLNYHDREDLVQDAKVRLLVGMKKYNPAKSSRGHFARVILDMWALDQSRRLRLRRSQVRVLRLAGEGPAAEVRHAGDAREEAEQLRAFVEAEQPGLLSVFDLLGRFRVTEIAAALGVNRATVHRRVRRIKELCSMWRVLRGRGADA